MVNNFALVNKSSVFEGIFVHAIGVNCTSLEIVRAKKIFNLNLFEATADIKI